MNGRMGEWERGGMGDFETERFRDRKVVQLPDNPV